LAGSALNEERDGAPLKELSLLGEEKRNAGMVEGHKEFALGKGGGVDVAWYGPAMGHLS